MGQLLDSITLSDFIHLWHQLAVELRKESLSLTLSLSDNFNRYFNVCCDMSDLLSCALCSCFLALSSTCLFKFSISCFNCWSMSFCLSSLCLIMLQALQVFILSRLISEVSLTFTIESSVICEAAFCEPETVAIFSWLIIVVSVLLTSLSMSCVRSEMIWVEGWSYLILWETMLLAVKNCWHSSHITQIVHWLHSAIVLVNLQYSTVWLHKLLIELSIVIQHLLICSDMSSVLLVDLISESFFFSFQTFNLWVLIAVGHTVTTSLRLRFELMLYLCHTESSVQFCWWQSSWEML